MTRCHDPLMTFDLLRRSLSKCAALHTIIVLLFTFERRAHDYSHFGMSRTFYMTPSPQRCTYFTPLADLARRNVPVELMPPLYAPHATHMQCPYLLIG